MPNKKISQLAVAGSLTGTELVPVVQSGVTVQTTTQDIADLGGGGAVETVTGNGVNNTDPLNPIVTPLLSDIATNNGGFLDDAPIADMINNLPVDTLTGSSLFMYRKNASGILAKESFTGLASFLQLIFDSVYATVSDLALKLPIQATQTTGVALTFLTDSVYGTIGTPETGNITYSATNAKIGVTNLIIHNNGTAPTFAANMKQLSGSSGYSVGVINYIFVTYINSTEVIYSINQRT
jgi:hypothetical protein